MNRSYIWSMPTRIFHWSFALLITICFIIDDDVILIHSISGYLILVPLTFRFIWGFIGPKYSKFKDFSLDIKETKEFASNIFEKKQKYIGHNPMASFVMISILLLVPFIILTGGISLGVEESKGIFSNFIKLDFFEDIHELLANLLYVLLFAHISGILVDRLLHKEHGTLNSIFTGYKNTKNKDDITLNIFQKFVAFLFLIIFLIFASYLVFNNSNIFVY